MPIGTITDFNVYGQLGVIESDDGGLVLFNLQGIPPAMRWRFGAGARVQFVEIDGPLAPRAVTLTPIEDSAADPDAAETNSPRLTSRFDLRGDE